MRRPHLLYVCAVLSIVGCRETEKDPCFGAGRMEVGGVCVAVDAGMDAGSQDAGTDAGSDAGTDAGPCNGACTGGTPHCREAGEAGADRCVECLTTAHCTGAADAGVVDGGAGVGRPLCSADGECVQCVVDSDCTSAENPVCNTGTGLCGGCTASTQCGTRFSGKPTCDVGSGDCVACTPTTEEADCVTRACDPEALTCTGAAFNTLGLCQACVSDRECGSGSGFMGTLKCVPTNFGSTFHGNYCLYDRSTRAGMTCPNTTTSQTAVASVGGVTATYCFPQQTLTTCEAVLQFRASGGCAVDEDCGADGVTDGRCRDDGEGLKCTYACGGDDVECRAGFRCRTGGDNYCCTTSTGVGCTP